MTDPEKSARPKKRSWIPSLLLLCLLTGALFAAMSLFLLPKESGEQVSVGARPGYSKPIIQESPGEPSEKRSGSPPPQGSPSALPAAGASSGSIGTSAPDPAAQVAQALASLSPGQILFNPPAEMVRSRTERVEVRIASSPETELLGGLKGQGHPQIEPIRVGLTMSVELLGPAFEVLALNEKEQLVPPGEYAQWAFDVTPLRSGTNQLTVRASAHVQVGDQNVARDIPVLDRQVQVHTDPGLAARDFLASNWEFVASGFLLPLLGFGVKSLYDLWRRHRRRRRGQRERPGKRAEIPPGNAP